MIKSNIEKEYPHHIAKYGNSDKSLYLTDYTNQTDSARGVKVFKDSPPSNIEYVTLQNDINLLNGFIIFDNTSFTRPDGSALSQCECVVFPEKSGNDSWIFFAELKYSDKTRNNQCNLDMAEKQLLETREYYYQKGIFLKTNPCYLLISLPKQKPPFANISLNPVKLAALKKRNIFLIFGNYVKISSDKMLLKLNETDE